MANLNIDYQRTTGQKSELFTVLATESGSFATRTAGVFQNEYNHGIVLIVKLANKAGTVTFTPQVQIQDEAGNAIVWWTAAAALAANGTATYVLFPGGMAGKGAGVTEAADVVMPREWKLALNYTGAGDGNEFDTSVYAYYI